MVAQGVPEIPEIKVVVQREDFDVGQESRLLHERSRGIGAIVTFTGLVRDLHGDERVDALFLEHYPGMTEKSLHGIADEATRRWPLIGATIIHRVGELTAGEQIVLVVASSAHRRAAFEACEFIMDYLKTRAPFWKKSRGSDGEHWVEAKVSDEDAVARWRGGDREGPSHQ